MNTVPEVDNEDRSGSNDVSCSGSGSHEGSTGVSGTGSGASQKSSSRSKFSLATGETLMIYRSKFLLMLVITVVAFTMSIITFYIIKDQERKEYENKFHNIATEISEFSQLKAKKVINNLERLGATLTSYADDAGQPWPFVDFPDFQVRGLLSNQDTGAHTISINPLVYPKDLDRYSDFTVANQGWMAEAHMYDKNVNSELYQVPFHEGDYVHDESLRWNVTGITPYMWSHQNDQYSPRERVAPAMVYAPIWQRAPPCDYLPHINQDLRSDPTFRQHIDGMMAADHPVITPVVDATYLEVNYDHRFDPNEQAEPHSYLMEPVYDNLMENRSMVAFLSAFVRWGVFFQDVLPSTEQDIYVVLESSCNQTFTYEIFGHKPVYLGEGNLHDKTLDSDGLDDTFEFYAELASGETDEHKFCHYIAHVYPSWTWREPYFTSAPYLYATAVFGCFLITALGFAAYDILVQRRQTKVMNSAARTNAIVTSLFPANVRDRLLEDAEREMQKGNGAKAGLDSKQSFLNNGMPKIGAGQPGGITSTSIFGSQPIADLFPATTIMFGDLVGFTAWSSTREPTQVFTLLETIYHSFDTIAKRRRVFKVETIGDCYVAVCGLPDPRKDHAVVMGKFASDCLNKMQVLVRQMETSLGPDTGDLNIRIGLHSGPVTAGVLRGDKGRFQLFGDTMNTASRMETTGQAGKIHVSVETAEILVSSGKGKWVTQREDKVIAKGKGALQTFWFKITSESHATGSNMTESSATSKDEAKGYMSSSSIDKALHLGNTAGGTGTEASSTGPTTEFDSLGGKEQRLVMWNVDILGKLLRQVMARRQALGNSGPKMSEKDVIKTVEGHDNVLDEVEDVLALPQFDARTILHPVDPNSITISPKAVSQLKDLVSKVAATYQKNSFHNFEHASHVTMSVTKLMSRIVTSHTRGDSTGHETNDQIAASLHDHTFGITSDPLTQFACIISALIHDADHPGVPNSTLVKENHPLASKYHGLSVAEQNSVDLAWRIIMNPEYKELHACIFGNSRDEFYRFRSIVVNVVMATDIMDKGLGAQRKARWAKAFSNEAETDDDASKDEKDSVEAVNRKATIVLEHLMQASDVAHTMQHWVVFKKWNERLFNEMYHAYVDGRSDIDPSKGWYQGELGFFDYYIIPLAKKLETCGVFGVSSHEYLSYAQNNRREWHDKGEQIVKDYVRRFHLENQKISGNDEADKAGDV